MCGGQRITCYVACADVLAVYQITCTLEITQLSFSVFFFLNQSTRT